MLFKPQHVKLLQVTGASKVNITRINFQRYQLLFRFRVVIQQCCVAANKVGFIVVDEAVETAQCLVARLSFTGELGYEIYVPAMYARSLYDELLEVGDKLGIRPFGIRALVSLGMEKSFGIWSREFTPDYTPAMCGFDRFIDYDKTGFIGRDAALLDHNIHGAHPHESHGVVIDVPIRDQTQQLT